jgi:hypothetical protein
MESRPHDERTVPRQPREEADAPNVPQPTQARADAIKEKTAGEEVGPLAAPRNVDVPYLGGDGIVGATLNCTMGNWDGEPTGYAYVWKSDGADVAGTGDSYVVAASDAGHSITCVVTASNDAGSTEAPPSNAVAVAAASTESSETRRK